MERGRNLQNNIFVIDREQQYLKTNTDCKGTYFIIYYYYILLYIIIYLAISCVFLLPTKMYAKRVDCRM